ncbi:MAG: UTP--glucose-1-phosphate uridylyltransferase [Spirochaetia bacterium]|nr:UTP--glucose-1-phosphate uridylyltransferase [Spirochaetia bacterium]
MKGVIIAAGYGTRFLPVTKTVPKEMLPIINRPSIDFIVEEFINSGITEILILTSRRKKALDDYFDRETELEDVFMKEKAFAKLEKIAPAKADIFFRRQTEMKGTGHALLQVKAFTGNEPFVVAYPDDLHIGDIPLAAQLIKRYEETGCSVMSALHDPPHLERYGVLKLDEDNVHVCDIVEKPAPGTEPSREVSIGRYLFTPDIFRYLEEGWRLHCENGGQGEYFHVYALKKLMEQNRVVYSPIAGERLDTGTPEGYLRAIVRYAMMDPVYKNAVLEEISRSK